MMNELATVASYATCRSNPGVREAFSVDGNHVSISHFLDCVQARDRGSVADVFAAVTLCAVRGSPYAGAEFWACRRASQPGSRGAG